MNKLMFKTESEPVFWQHWQKVLAATKAGPRYSSMTAKSFILIAKDQGIFHADKSFVYLQNGRPAAAVFFPLMTIDGTVIASVTGDFLYAPLLANKSVEKQLFVEIDKLARSSGVAKIEFQIDPLDKYYAYNWLQKYGYLESSVLAYVMDLTVPDFLSSCRADHRARIKKMLADPEVEIFHIDGSNPDYRIHEQYREMHQKMAGRVARPKETFDLQFERLKLGEAVLFGVKYRGRRSAFAYFDFRTDKGNYASSVHDPDMPALAFSHILVYRAAEYLKKIGVKLIDSEQPSAPSSQFGFSHDKKQLNIALFKRGFGGRFVQNFRGVKYFSKEVLAKDLSKFAAQYQLS